MPRHGVRFLLYNPLPPGIDTHWTTSLEVYCYLYHHPQERAHLQVEADEEEVRIRHKFKTFGDTPEEFQIWHHSTNLDLQIRARTSDEVFRVHLKDLLAQIGVVMSDPGPSDSMLAYSLIFTNNLRFFQLCFDFCDQGRSFKSSPRMSDMGITFILFVKI